MSTPCVTSSSRAASMSWTTRCSAARPWRRLGDPDSDGDRAGRAGRRHLHDAERLCLLAGGRRRARSRASAERLRAVDVGDGDRTGFRSFVHVCSFRSWRHAASGAACGSPPVLVRGSVRTSAARGDRRAQLPRSRRARRRRTRRDIRLSVPQPRSHRSASSVSVLDAARLARTASPSAPPIMKDVLTTPEARPASLGSTSPTAASSTGLKAIPAPSPSRIMAGARRPRSLRRRAREEQQAGRGETEADGQWQPDSEPHDEPRRQADRESR